MYENYLFDTDILIDILRGYAPSKEYLRILLLKNNVKRYISIITVGELYSGDLLNKNTEKIETLESLLKIFRPIDINYQIMKKAGEIKRKYKIVLVDAIIAATAKVNNYKIITRNKKHFKKIKNTNIIIPY